jgi:hypothetical protein
MSILREKIRDNRLLRLIEHLLKAGYVEQWTYRPTMAGTPQGGIVSPILANIYLDKLDTYVEHSLQPAYTCGKRRAPHGTYKALMERYGRARKGGRHHEAKALRQAAKRLPAVATHDPTYRRLRYIRYADDTLLGFVGPKSEAEDIKAHLRTFLHDTLKLELSEEKTLITHAKTQTARFLGYDLRTQHSATRRTVNGRIALRVPVTCIESRRARYLRHGKVTTRPELMPLSDFEIVSHYQAEYRGVGEYYALAQNLRWLNYLRYTMETSLLRTLATKHQASVTHMAEQYRATHPTPDGPRKCIKVVVPRTGKQPLMAYFGGISLKRRANATITDRPRFHVLMRTPDLVHRLQAGTCEVCGSTMQVEVHHIRKLADLNRPRGHGKPLWMRMMIARQRKTLVLCRTCHRDLHAGRPLVRQADLE